MAGHVDMKKQYDFDDDDWAIEPSWSEWIIWLALPTITIVGSLIMLVCWFFGGATM